MVMARLLGPRGDYRQQSGCLRSDLLAGACWGREADEQACVFERVCRVSVQHSRLLIAAISVSTSAVGCVTMPSDGCRCVMLHPPAKSHVMGSRAPLQAGAGRGMAACRFLEDARLGYRPMNEAEQRPPQIALGYPWASSLVCRLHARPRRRCWVRAWWSNSLS
jgi:hypothetical protein